MNDIVVTVAGNVAGEVRHLQTKRNGPMASFRLAVRPRRWSREKGWHELETVWFSVTSFRGLADNVASSVANGDPVMVSGRMRVRLWENADGKKGQDLEIDAWAVGHDLARGTSAFTKNERPTQAEEDDIESVHAALTAEVREHGNEAAA